MENTNNNILEIKNLHTYFYTDSGVIKSVDGVDIELREAQPWIVENQAAARA